jgi:transposase
MEDHIGRYLSGLELVHHINGERADNRIENLQVVSQGEHARIHNKGRSRLTEEMVREALVGRTTKEAAKHLGVVHQTIRNQFDHLLKKRKKKYTPDDAELREAILKYHDDPTMGTYEFVHKFHVAYKTIVAMCEHLGVQWVKKKRSDIGLRRKPRKSRIKANDSTSGLDVHGES